MMKFDLGEFRDYKDFQVERQCWNIEQVALWFLHRHRAQ